MTYGTRLVGTGDRDSELADVVDVGGGVFDVDATAATIFCLISEDYAAVGDYSTMLHAVNLAELEGRSNR